MERVTGRRGPTRLGGRGKSFVGAEDGEDGLADFHAVGDVLIEVKVGLVFKNLLLLDQELLDGHGEEFNARIPILELELGGSGLEHDLQAVHEAEAGSVFGTVLFMGCGLEGVGEEIDFRVGGDLEEIETEPVGHWQGEF